MDINRNWDSHWEPPQVFDETYQTNPGTAPFSEPETAAILAGIRNINPNSYISIHSGMNSVMYPFAYSDVSPVDDKYFNIILDKIVPLCEGIELG